MKEPKLTEEVSQFLIELRASGVTNMFGATPYLQNEFGFSEKEARDLLMAWMKSFRE